MNKRIFAIISLVLSAQIALGAAWQSKSEKLTKMESALKDDVPRVLCLDDNFTTGAQPTQDAYSKLAANGFRSVLNLRTAQEGAEAEKELVEKSGLRYINIPVLTSALNDQMVEDFIKAVNEKSNHPMLIHCGSANRVGAFWMIYRVVEQGWAEDKAYEEAVQIGLTSPALKKFAEDYIAGHKTRMKKGD